MSELLRLALQDISEGLDFSTEDMTPHQQSTAGEVLLAVFREEGMLDGRDMSHTAFHLGWSIKNIDRLLYIGYLVLTEKFTLAAGAQGFGFQIVTHRKIELALKAATAKRAEELLAEDKENTKLMRASLVMICIVIVLFAFSYEPSRPMSASERSALEDGRG